MISRPALALTLLSLVLLVGCPSSINIGEDPARDAGLDAIVCVGGAPLCVTECGTAEFPATCSGGDWICPLGSFDALSCDCPDDLDSACTVEDATCSEGTQCGSAMFCSCESGAWICAIAEPDPVCTCEAEPSVGDPCVGAAVTCGSCCATLDGPHWAAMDCVEGRWQPAECEGVVCPPLPLECLADIDSLLGTECGHEGQSCGNECCGSAVCNGGTWEAGPDLDPGCECPGECGPGSCASDQSCNERCDSDGEPEFHCVPLGACDSCECVTLELGQSCEMMDGRVHIIEDAFCG